jgi:cysteine desulfurase
MKTIYADNNATTQVAPEVVEAMSPFFTDQYFNPSSMYEPARQTHQAVANARWEIARHFELTDPEQILFTSCATESNNAAIFGAAKARPNRRHVVTTTVEHPAVLEVCKELERNDYEVTFLKVDGDGNLDIREFIRALRPDTLLVTIMHANNETGVIFPIEQFSRITKETDPTVLFHTDATQTVGKLPINLRQEFQYVDLLSFSGHKFHAPKGIGGLYLKKGTPCRPLLIGGHQEEGRRAGTENVPYIVGMAKALQLATQRFHDEETRVRLLRDKLEKAVVERIPSVQINGCNAMRMPNSLNVSCHGVEGEGMLMQLMTDYGICASSGSACTTGSLEPSHVLRAMNVPFTAVHGSVRFSLSYYNTDDDVDRIIEAFPKIVANLRKSSPYWDREKNVPRPEAKLL